ncbi:MAG: hypothetical protein J0I77_05475 [Rudaea sp.]|uniref:trigger factor n=1 Tax=unclassified Rudaea TaxID=2627037 RepID=UPI0010F692AE|nr:MULTISPECIES: trigger factor [unclassified Rudaea]MBN8885149.1 hypothetical protein [Rudaea sp.]MBR0345756.1 hypothetical protein [Rudaea sp.]
MPPAVEPGADEALIEILDDCLPASLHLAAWQACQESRWQFGHGSARTSPARFWKMDLDGHPVFDEIWRQLRARCEALAGHKLRVVRQYANGHTFGLGGALHRDDGRSGTFTLLFYPHPEWKLEWEGETVFHRADGEIALASRVVPNRAVFFDSRIFHAGRAPSRHCPELRVTVAFKLEREAATPNTAAAPALRELRSDGIHRVYAASVPASAIAPVIAERLAAIGATVRLPGFAPGQIPPALLEERYGRQARADALKSLAAALTRTALPDGSVASACRLIAGADEGDMEVEIDANHLPSLPMPDFAASPIIRLQPSAEAREQVPAAGDFVRQHLRTQVLDRLDGYAIALFPLQVDHEINIIRASLPAAADIADATLREIAERRLRLGLVIGEMARRLGIRAADTAALENAVIDHFLSAARTEDRPVDAAVLRAMMA